MTSLRERHLIRRLYWTSFALRFSVGLLAWFLTQYAKLPIMEDALGYSQQGADVAQAWLSGRQSTSLVAAIDEGRQAWFMVAVLGVIYCFTGGIPILPLALGGYCLITSFTPVLAYRASRRLGMPFEGAMIGARLIAYSPAFAFWCSALYKEGLVLLALFLIIEHTLRLQQTFQPISALILSASLLALFGLRFYIAAILCLTLAAGLVLGRRRAHAASGLPPVLRQVLVLVLLASIFSLFGLTDRLERLLSVDLAENLQQINNSRQDLASYQSGYLQNTDVSSVDKAVQFLPIGVAYFLTVPLPWHIGSFRQNIAIPETLFWIIVVYPRVIVGIRRGASRNPQGLLFLVLSAVAICCFYGLFIGNIGTAYRLRIQVWAIFALLAGWGWQRTRPVPLTVHASRKDRADTVGAATEPSALIPLMNSRC